MADFDFYTNVYLGSKIPEKQFPMLAAQAASILEGYARSYTVSCPGPDSRNLAICAMAECIQENDRLLRGLMSATVSARYEKDRQPLHRQLMGKARIYLDIYRGVS